MARLASPAGRGMLPCSVMSFDANALLASIPISGAGFVLFVYGKKQSRLPHMVFGLAMMGYPYFVTSIPWMFGVAAALTGALVLAVRVGL
jgi:hypothetical protein